MSKKSERIAKLKAALTDDADVVASAADLMEYPLNAELRISAYVDRAAITDDGIAADVNIGGKLYVNGEPFDLDINSAKEYLDLGPVIGILHAMRKGLWSERGISITSAVEDSHHAAEQAKQMCVIEEVLELAAEASLEDAECGGTA